MKLTRKLTISLLLASIALGSNVCYAAPVVMPEDKLEKLEFIVKTFKMPPKNIWVYATIVVVLIIAMMLDLRKYAPKKLQNNKHRKNSKTNTVKHNDNVYLHALDGIRALAVICIFIFHDWQQTWIDFDFKIGDFFFPLGNLQRYGFLAVNLFFVLSGFCLFYPLARHDIEGGPVFNWKDFYIKRLRRIIPANYLIIIVILIFPILTGSIYPMPGNGYVLKTLLANLTFTQNLYMPAEGAFSSTIWTLAVEVQFYLLVPFIVWCFKRKPKLTISTLCLIAWLYRLSMLTGDPITKQDRMCMISFLDDFSVGMVGAYILVYMRNKFDLKRAKYYMTAISLVCIPLIWQFFMWLPNAYMEGFDAQEYWRCLYRFPLCIVLVIWIISTCLSCDFWSKKVYGNKVAQYFASISYAFFLWHQNIHILLNRLNIPKTKTPVRHDDRDAMWIYMFLSFVISLIIATASTYLIEKPIVKYGYKGAIKRLFTFWKKKEE